MRADQIPQAAVTVCRLRAEREVLTQRFVGRGGQASLVQDALPSATITLVRRHAGRDQLTRRILLRGQGRGSWPQPGDPLLAQSTEPLLRIADQAAAQAGALERASIGAVSVDTDRRTVEEAADVIIARTGWPGRAI